MGFVRNNTESTLFSKLNKISNLIVNEIDNDQTMKRYLSYLSYQPLESKSANMSGKVMYQDEITSSMLGNQKICISKSTATTKEHIELPQILFPYPYQYEKVNMDYCTLFSYWDSCNVRNNDLIYNSRFLIDVLVPSLYLELKPYGENRGYAIIDRLAYLFNNVSLDDTSMEEVGDLKFYISGTPKSSRITKSNEITIFTIPVIVTDINARSDINGGIYGG